ncbi:MAG: hypothetical protein QOJ94_768 [Sphingomonadales bacterium]|jgi:predicted nucleic-acid-binding protein|nr:hypothetical protein [Sphingomonadales bacterium]
MVEKRAARRLVRALDANVILRFLIGDDAVQGEQACRLVATPCFASLTVLLETAWVLSSRYGFERAEVAQLLVGFIDLPSVAVEDLEALRWAVGRFEAGADFADMVHLVASRSFEAFATFDRGVARAAGPESPIPVETIS